MTERLTTTDLARDFGDGAGVFGIDLTVRPGEIHALVGLNGAGKTTLMRLILGMLHPTGGACQIDGRRLAHLGADDWARVGHLVEQPFAYPELDVRTNLRLAARLRRIPAARAASLAEHAMTELDLTRYATVSARRLSQGNRQRLGLAAATQHHPDLIVLDEPTNALDPAGVILLRTVLSRRADAGAGILVSSHHLDEVARIAHRISVVNRGRLIGTLDPDTADLERTFFALVYQHEQDRPR
ncbi:ABC transporter ATP-binding protein [Micromonospora craniellae]|uniref:ABC transporter ATP-binding protein n=1 Tax=Micromonospora craniellae TaxID=2294034 RepID=A0A372FRE7_9ACTN|nr:ABC transporter ATP-binding protein [Micromonospora craniellae]QOC91355.1 ABC transporter ATP-binding protein [Micromonospora craniellae]RFS43352.1 ABC transporter ATP-binding protein [Micromonospora craniellae]